MTNVTTWRDKTRELLNNRPVSLTIEQIAKELNVSAAWIRMFARNKIENPGIVTVQTLNEFLKNYKKKA